MIPLLKRFFFLPLSFLFLSPGCERKLTPVPFHKTIVEISPVTRIPSYYAYRKPSEDTYFPDAPRTARMHDGRLYVAAGPGGLAIIDAAASPQASSLLGQFITDPFVHIRLGGEGVTAERGDTTGFLVDGVRAFLAVNGTYWAWGGRTMIVALDISNPADIRKVGERLLPGKGGWADRGILAHGMSLEDSHLAIAAGSFQGTSLAEVWDVGDPRRMRRVASLSLAGADVRDVLLINQILFFAIQGPGKEGGEHGVLIYRLNDLADGKAALAKCPTPTPARKLHRVAQTLLVACDDLGLVAVEASDPAAPKKLYPPENVPPLLKGEVSHLAVSEKFAWVLSRFTEKNESSGQDRTRNVLSLFNIENLQEPKFVTSAELDEVGGIGPGLEGSVCLTYRDGRVAKLNPRDLKNPDILLGPGALMEGLVKRRDLLYVACGRGGVAIFDVSQPSRPQPLGNASTRGYARKIFLDGSRLLVAQLADGLSILDVADPKKPVTVGHWVSNAGEIQDVFAEQNFAYLASDHVGLEILSIQDPAQPKPVGLLKLEEDAFAHDGHLDRSNPRGIFVRAGLAYLANGRFGLAVIDVSDPANPRLVSRLYDEKTRKTSFWDVWASGNLLWMADVDQGFFTASLQDPPNPSLLARFHTGQANAAAISGSYAFIADGGYGIKALDISEPSKPTYRGGFTLNEENFNDIAVENGYLFTACSTGLRVLKFTEAQREFRTAFAMDRKQKPAPIFPSEKKLGDPADFYGKHLTILDDGIDVCSSSYEGHDSLNGPLRPVVADLSEASGWPQTPVEQGTLAIDPKLGRIKFPDGDDDSMGILGFCWLAMGIPNQGILRGDFFYAANMEGLNVVIADVTDPGRPRLASVVATQGFASAVSVDGTVLAAPNVVFGTTFFDVSDPYHPRPIGFLKGEQYLRGIRLVDGGKKFFSINPKTQKYILTDIADPRNPKTIGEYEFIFSPGQKYHHGIKNIELDTKKPDGTTQKRAVSVFQIWDIERPESPRDLGHLLLEDLDFSQVGRSSSDLFPCIAMDPAKKFHLLMVNSSDKNAPLLVSRLDLGRGVGRSEVLDPVLQDDTVYIGGYILQVVDVKEPKNPKLLGAGNLRPGHLGEPPRFQGSPWIKDHFVLMTNPLHGLDVFDVSDKANPNNIAGLAFQGGDWLGVFARDHLAASANNWGGAQLVDVSDKTKPRLVANTRYLNEGGGQSPVITPDSTLLVYQGSMMMHGSFGGLAFVDITRPDQAKFIAKEGCGKSDFYQTDPKLPRAAGGYCSIFEREIASDKNSGPQKLRLAIYPQDCTIVDITHPAQPKILGNNPEAGGYTGAVAGNIYYTMGDQFKCVDLTDLARPKVVGRCDGIPSPLMYGRAITYRAGRIYLASIHVVYVINVTDPTHPFVENTVQVSGFAVDASVLGDRLYVGAYYGSLHVFDITDPGRPKKMCYFGDGVYWDYAFVNLEHCYESFYADRGCGYVNEYGTGLIVIDLPTSPEPPRGAVTAILRR